MVREERSQDKGSDQGSKFNNKHCLYNGKKTQNLSHSSAGVCCSARSVQAAKIAKFPLEPATAAKTDVSVQVNKTCCGKCSRSA